MSLRTWALVTAALVPFLGTLAAEEPEKTSESFRKEYLEKFPWTLANTTAGDAMTLRILVADNVIDDAGQMPDFLEYVQSSPLYDTQIIRASMQKNDGMSISDKIP